MHAREHRNWVVAGARNRRCGFTIRDLVVLLTCLLVAAGLVMSLGGANRSLSQASKCTANLETLFGGLTAYVNAYNSYPPHNPYPRWTNAPSAFKDGISGNFNIDPSIGWILTYGLGMTPPATYMDDPDYWNRSPHFKWFVLNEDELPDVVVCPAANRTNLFTMNPEIDTNNDETFIFQYAAFYQTSGTCRSATLVKTVTAGQSTQGGRNPAIPDPTSSLTSRIADNAYSWSPRVWVFAKTGDPTNPDQFGNEVSCWLQAVHPSEVQDPGRVYYMADSREYRPTPGTWPGAATSDGWHCGYGNLVFMSTRHYEHANVMYLDGQVNRDNQAHPRLEWNMDYDSTTQQARSSRWRCSTFATTVPTANVKGQVHIMPVLMVKGWEYFFTADGAATK